MLKLNSMSVQAKRMLSNIKRLPFTHAVFPSVQRVTEYRQPQMSEVDTNLIGAPGDRSSADKRCTVFEGPNPIELR